MKYERVHCPICGCPFERQQYGQRHPRLFCSTECRAAWMRIRREGYRSPDPRTVLEACRAYAERAGVPLKTAQRAWGLK